MASNSKTGRSRPYSRIALSGNATHGRIVSAADKGQCLDTTQLSRLEQTFRAWSGNSSRADIRLSRQRILMIFLMIRYTGAKLNEVLTLNPRKDIDPVRHAVFLGNAGSGTKPEPREVQISERLSAEIRNFLAGPAFQKTDWELFDVDPGFVRRKFYEQTQFCGFPKHLGSPEMIRKARAVELMRGNMPLPAVQMMLGHSTPNLTSSYVSFSEDEIRQVSRLFMERESSRKTSARNSFFGKIQTIRRGDIQARVDLKTIDGHCITTIITTDSLDRLGLKPGRLISAEVKAPWVILENGDTEPESSAENRLKGVLTRIARGRVNSECVVKISDTTELCAIVATERIHDLKLKAGKQIWALFNCFSVVLHVD